MSPHPSCKETNLSDLFSFGSKDTTIVKTPLINDTGSTWDWAEMQRIFFAVKVADLFIRGYVWEFFNLYKHNLCHRSGVSSLVKSSKFFVPILAPDQPRVVIPFIHRLTVEKQQYQRQNSPGYSIYHCVGTDHSCMEF